MRGIDLSARVGDASPMIVWGRFLATAPSELVPMLEEFDKLRDAYHQDCGNQSDGC